MSHLAGSRVCAVAARDDERIDLIRARVGEAYPSVLPGARAAVLARLWGALVREPIAGITQRQRHGARQLLLLADGRQVSGPAQAAVAFAPAEAGLRISIQAAGVDSAMAGVVCAYDDPAELLRQLRLPGESDRLATELANSVANLALARAGQPHPDGGAPILSRLAAGADPDPLAFLEQSVVDGHPLHPCCRTRLGLDTAELWAYAPEFRPTIALPVFEVPPDRWFSTGAGIAPRLPLHPWQADHVQAAYPWLRDTGHRILARPLMSLRTLAWCQDPTVHLKTAINVQMTSAVRTVSPAAVRNGPAVSALLAAIAARTDGLVIARETAAGAVLLDGEPLRELAVIRRTLPRLRPGDLVLPLAALAAPSMADGRPILCDVIRLGDGAAGPVEFFDEIIGLLIPAILTALRAGVALEAHGQNTLLVLRHGRPVQLIYRDVGGVRVSPRRLAAAGLTAPPLHGELATQSPDALRTKVFAAAITTVVAELIALLGREFGLEPDPLWGRVATVARHWFRRDGDATRHWFRRDGDANSDAAAFFGATMPMKAMTAMRLSTEPLDDVWTSLPNPMAL